MVHGHNDMVRLVFKEAALPVVVNKRGPRSSTRNLLASQ